MFYGKKYYTRTEFKQIKNKNTVIVGYTSKEKWEAGKHRTLEKLDYENSIYYVRPFIFGVTTGYIEVNDNEFIKVREHSLLMILILLLITGCMVLMGNFFLKEPGSVFETVGEKIEEYIGDTASITEYTEVPGLHSSYSLTENNKEIFLVNPEGNTVYFKYTLYIDGEAVYESGHVEPGKMVKANLYDILGGGRYAVDVTVSTLDVDTHEVCNGANLSTNVVVNK